MRVAIFLMNGCVGTVIHGIPDILLAANYSMIKQDNEAIFEWHTVSIDGLPITPINGIPIAADYSLSNYLSTFEKTDVWILPPFFNTTSHYEKLEACIRKTEPLIPVIQRHYQSGGTVFSVCSGSFLLAKAELMDGRPASMHWQLENYFKRMFPHLEINTDQSIADYGRVISVVGGHVAYGYMVLRLVERNAGHDVAVRTAKLMMMSLNPPSPQTYRPNVLEMKHQDQLVHRADDYLQDHFQKEVSISDLADHLNISERQLNRRFIKALNVTPIQHLQNLRIQQACHLLESCNLACNKIVYEIGYQDESSFRRLFKKHKAMTMENYRKRFGLSLRGS